MKNKQDDTMGELKKLKKEISKILVKWNMPTRQVAISEIANLVAKERGQELSQAKERGINKERKEIVDTINFVKRIETEFRRDIKDSYGEEMVRATCNKILIRLKSQERGEK